MSVLIDAPKLASDGVDGTYIPTNQRMLDAMFDVASVTANDVVVDLGSGDGRITLDAARRGVERALGVEFDAKLVDYSRQLAEREGYSTTRCEFVHADIFAFDASIANVVMFYLLPRMIAPLSRRLSSTLRPGTRIVSNTFEIPDFVPDVTLPVPIPPPVTAKPPPMPTTIVSSTKSTTTPNQASTPDKTEIPTHANVYLYVVPRRVQGRWEIVRRSSSNSIPMTLELLQQFQSLHGQLDFKPIKNARIQNDRVTFTSPFNDEIYNGIVSDDGRTMIGDNWSAKRIE